MKQLLEDCPFCASQQLQIVQGLLSQRVVCTICSAQGSRQRDALQAVNAWNRISHELQLTRRIETRKMVRELGGLRN
ncbi:Lar family restriction alleviation protein [Aestuariirhabdus sp. LZHN29]|uniref:Lar family restriction alleviation protein n=1 Tax=Aestuariirhabdus sp. LZHN29 TaxID=3417462 RepID=UPI003CF4E93B